MTGKRSWLRNNLRRLFYNNKMRVWFKIFAWFLVQNKILAQGNLTVRGWNITLDCVYCGNTSLETRDHLMWNCQFARNLRRGIYPAIPKSQRRYGTIDNEFLLGTTTWLHQPPTMIELVHGVGWVLDTPEIQQKQVHHQPRSRNQTEEIDRSVIEELLVKWRHILTDNFWIDGFRNQILEGAYLDTRKIY